MIKLGSCSGGLQGMARGMIRETGSFDAAVEHGMMGAVEGEPATHSGFGIVTLA